MSDTETRMMRYTIEQLSAELQATRQYVGDIESKLDRTRNALDVAKTHLGYIKNNYHSWTPHRDEQMIAQAANCLAKIQELEDGNL